MRASMRSHSSWLRPKPAVISRLTAMGERVMSGQEDALALGSIDHWLGGVHLAGSPRWRWDQAQGELVSIR